MRRITIGNQMYDVITPQQYLENKDSYLNESLLAIQESDGNVYPLKRGKILNDVGWYDRGGYGRVVKPSEQKKEKYSENNIIDFNNAKDIHEIIEMNEVYNNMEREILVTPDNLYKPKHTETESGLSYAVKESMIAKNFDINKYQSKWNPKSAFNNDKKEINKDDISIKKAIRIWNNTDIVATLTLKDKNPNVPNPMGREITVTLNDYNDEE